MITAKDLKGISDGGYFIAAKAILQSKNDNLFHEGKDMKRNAEKLNEVKRKYWSDFSFALFYLAFSSGSTYSIYSKMRRNRKIKKEAERVGRGD